MTTTWKNIETWIDAHVEQMVELQRLLTAIPAIAPESGGDGEAKKCRALKKWLAKAGIKDIVHYDAPDSRVRGGVRPNLVATIPGRKKDAVWIIAHTDVVPEGERKLWTGDPWKLRRDGSKLIGRGVEDNQQAIVSGAFAALSFLKTHTVPERTIKLLFAADEEVGSAMGMHYLLEHHNLFSRDDLIVVPDSGVEDGRAIEVAEKNMFWFKFTVKGKQTHASHPDQGVNAFLAGSALALVLHGMRNVFHQRDKLFSPPWSTFEPTKKEANVPNVNTIPGEDVFYLDCRILPRYSLDQVRDQVARRAAQIEAQYGVRITAEELQANESPPTKAEAPVVRALADAVKRVYGVNTKPVGIGGGTVAAPLRAKGYDAAVWCRIKHCAHQPDEYCLVENLVGDTKVFARIMLGQENAKMD
ncbi:MAG: M20 family metallo-hydrolase [Spirochaetaceae bacterium]|nr:M20 family metallo-hydrolase [Spirochaetaceae bacterium]